MKKFTFKKEDVGTAEDLVFEVETPEVIQILSKLEADIRYKKQVGPGNVTGSNARYHISSNSYSASLDYVIPAAMPRNTLRIQYQPYSPDYDQMEARIPVPSDSRTSLARRGEDLHRETARRIEEDYRFYRSLINPSPASSYPDDD